MAGFTVKGGSLSKSTGGGISTSAVVTAVDKTALGLMRVYIITENAPSILVEAKIKNLSQNNIIQAIGDGCVDNPVSGVEPGKMILEASISAAIASVTEEESSNENCRQILFKPSEADYADGSLQIRIAGYAEKDVTIMVSIQNEEDLANANTNIAVKEKVAASSNGEITLTIPFTVGALS